MIWNILSNGDCVNSICQVIDNASKQFPNSKIFYSNLLTRTDEHQSRVKTTNAAVYKEVEKLPNVHIINTSNIPAELLHDRKHLNKEGVYLQVLQYFLLFLYGFHVKKTCNLWNYRNQIKVNQSINLSLPLSLSSLSLYSKLYYTWKYYC